MKCIYTQILLHFLVYNIYAQDSLNQALNIRLRYDSAKVEFENYEKMHGRFIQTQNIKMHYLEWGNPKHTPLIWIHGSFTNGYELSSIATDIVKKGYYLIAIDYYGHGLTKIPKHEVSLYHVADDIKELMEFKKIKKAVIGGWSRGGIIATAFYDSYPDNVLGLILEDGGSVSTNTYYHKMSEVQLNERVSEIFKDKFSYSKYKSRFEAYKAYYDYSDGGTQYSLLAWITMDEDGMWSIGTGVEDLFNMKNEAQFLDNILRPTKATLFGESMSIIEPKIVYRNLNVPMLILDPVSDNDILPYEKENQELSKQHPDLIVYKKYNNTGHNIHYEKPKEFIEDLGEFIKKIKTDSKTNSTTNDIRKR
ncbi:MAG: alpha/beta fold hydrolase [Cyclobacteriaceae bacterium]